MKKMDDDSDDVATRTRFVLSPRRGCGLLRFEQRPEGLTVLPDDGKAFGAITVDLASASIVGVTSDEVIGAADELSDQLGGFGHVKDAYG